MENFEFCSPTKIYFGKDKENSVGEIIKSYGFKKILFHYGKSSIFKTGLYEKVVNSLNENNIQFIELGGVEANPDITLVRKGVEICKSEGIDFILAVGGGSVLDSSKSIAAGTYYEGNPLDFNMKKATPKKALPVGAILTIAAAGSELSTSCVISDRSIQFKKGFNSQLNRPLFVIENPELTNTLPFYQVGCGIVDIIAHTLERYFNKSQEIEFADYIAEGLLKSVIDSSEMILKDPYNYDARATLMLASSFSHNGLTSIGKEGKMPVHQLEHEVSALKDHVAHGAGLAVLIPSWMEKVWEKDKEKFKKFALNVMRVTNYEDDEDLIIKGIYRLQDLFVRLDMPRKLSEFGINEEDVEVMANRLTNNGTVVYDCSFPMDKKLVLDIYYHCL